MKIFSLDSPLMVFLGKMADLMWLNILTLICCIPIVTAGAAFTALHYMSLKIVRNEECYITKGFFKSFKQNFKQATIIWLIMLLAIMIIAADYYIILKTELELHIVIKVVVLAATSLMLFTMMYVFPVLSKFDNTIKNTIKNAFAISIAQFPKTILMIIACGLPIAVMFLSYELFPVVLLFGFSGPALIAAMLYNKFFQRLEDGMVGTDEENESSEEESGEDERIFKDELDESIVIDEKRY